jgi:flavin reductase (DIM6/NTAB) family NADH-FMN oxidoreductase RutF
MAHELATLFKQITAGVYVIGIAHQEKRNAFTAGWVIQVSFTPLLLAVSINPEHSSYPLLMDGRVFSVNVLRRGQIELARHFGRRSEGNKLRDIAWRTAITGAPILANALAYFDCRLMKTYPAGDHVLAIGQVLDGALLSQNAIPMRYAETGDLDGSHELYPDRF